MSDQHEAVFARYDTDRDGRLTVTEVTEAIAGMFPAAEVNDLSGIARHCSSSTTPITTGCCQ